MLKVIAACGNGMGSSQIIKMKIEKIFKNLNIPVSIHHTSIGTIVIGLKNLLSEKEIEEKIVENIVNK